MTNTEQKEQFEGVRAEVSQCSLNAHMGSLKLRREDGKLVANLDMHMDLAKSFAAAWNNQATLKSEMNELADKIVELEKSSNNSLDKLGDSNGKLLLACSNLSDKDAEITRIKEENERLSKELAESRAAVEDTEIARVKLRQANTRLDDELGRNANHIQDLQSQLSQAKERIRELETPDYYMPNSDQLLEYETQMHETLDGVIDQQIYAAKYKLCQVAGIKIVGVRYCFRDKDENTVVNFTEEQAQAALKEGE